MRLSEGSAVRERLRVETRPQHARVDTLYGTLDVSERSGYAHFLNAHVMALRVVETAVRRSIPHEACPPGLSALAEADLRSLGWPEPGPWTVSPPEDADPLGVTYVVAGAHLGNAVMRARWMQSTDRSVLAAGSYLSDRSMRQFWPKFLLGLDSRVDSRGYEAVLAGAIFAFELFERSFHRSAR